MSAVAITDHGNMFAAIEFYQAALKRGVKPILGFEAYVCSGDHKNHTVSNKESFHLVLLARNWEGYKNLVKLASAAYTDGFYYKPKIDHALLEQHSEGVIALSACLAGEIPRALLGIDTEKVKKSERKLIPYDRENPIWQERLEEAKKRIRYYQGVFGKENFFVEIQNHGIEAQLNILPALIDVAKECDAPLVATNDSHYVNKEDWSAQDALLAMATNTKIDDENRFRFESREFYFKSEQEMRELFGQWPESLTNTRLIAERCNVQIPMGKSILPKFDLPEGESSESYMRSICEKGLKRRYGEPPYPQEVMTRYEFEFNTIKSMGFLDYFLIVWEFINWARENDIPVGPGRGSAAGAIVSYLMGITDIDPLKYDLLFERFLNPERISMPDIDVDFADEDRPRVIEHVKQVYGDKRVSGIITFNFLLAKNAIRNIGRTLGMELPEVDKIAKLVPNKPGMHLKKAIEETPELKDLMENGTPEQKRLLKLALAVDGSPSHTGVHACGIVISAVDLDDICPLFMDKDGYITTQYEKKAVEEIGLLKMDFLGLKTLTIIKNAVENVKESQGIDIDLEHLNVDDAEVYKLLSSGLTLGVFQLDSSGMRQLLQRLKPTVFEDIIALLAMYRPGPLKSGMVDDFVKRKHGETALAYPHPLLEPVLKDTYGVYLYQEQVMQTSRVLAGFTKGEADGLRKAMGKKLVDKMAVLGEKFVKQSSENGVDPKTAQSIFDLMAGFGEYGFNKSHSAAYAVVTYRTAWLKAHYPVEFMSSVLFSEINDVQKIAEYIQECQTMGINVLPPDINHSYTAFKVENGAIRYGLSALKGVGISAIDSIVKERDENGPFTSFANFTRRINPSEVNSKVIEMLIKCGALDCFGLKKSQMLVVAGDSIKKSQKIHKDKSIGQNTFFDIMSPEEDNSNMEEAEVEVPDIPELTDKELLQYEKDSIGFYLTGNPYTSVAPIGKVFNTMHLSDIVDISEKLKNNELEVSEAEMAFSDVIRISGILTGFKKHLTKKGDTMAFVTIEADNSSFDLSIFPKTYEECGAKLKIDEPVFVIAQAQIIEDQVKLSAEKVLVLEDFNEEGRSKITLNIPSDKAIRDNYVKLAEILTQHIGKTPVDLIISDSEGDKIKLRMPGKKRASVSPPLFKAWEQICGIGSVKLELTNLDGMMRRNGFRKRVFSNSGE